MKPKLAADESFIKRANKERRAGPYRSGFMRDRDRILYSKPFRRLSKKTQIFLPTSDDHTRTRLTHTLEVAQIATTSASALSLDRDLAEAISIGHDLGHTPFGHSGERTLNLILCNCDNLGGLSTGIREDHIGFKHNLQGIRIATELASLYEGYTGLNLSNLTLWGIKNHTSDVWKTCNFLSSDDKGNEYCNIKPLCRKIQCTSLNKELKFYSEYDNFLHKKGSDEQAWSFEGYLVKIADEIAQRHHDAEDGLIAKLISKDEIISILESTLSPFFNREERIFFIKTKDKSDNYFTQRISRIIVGTLNRNLIENSLINLRRFANFYKIKTRNDFLKIYPSINTESLIKDSTGELVVNNIISYPNELKAADKRLQDFLKDRVLNSYQVQRMDGKAKFILRQLAKAYLTNPQQLPDNCVRLFFLKFNEYEGNSIGDMRNWLSEKYFSHKKDDNHVLIRIIADFLSGMTDEFACMEHHRLYSSSENFNIRHY